MITIRSEQPEDEAQVRHVNEQAFGQPDEAVLVDRLRQTPDAISLVAVKDATVVGHILFTPVTVGAPGVTKAAGLAPMAVLPGHQRTGIGGQLIRAGLDECRRAGYEAVVVVGHPEYYPRFGFVPAHTRGLAYPDVPPEAFMVLELSPGALAGATGFVRYRPEFDA